jgi:hypothetical protein
MKKLTPENIKEILQLYPDTPTDVLALKFGVRNGTIYQIAMINQVRKDKAFLAKNIADSHRKINEDDLKKIEALYPKRLSGDLARMFGISSHTVDGYSTRYGWKKDPDFKRDTARDNMNNIRHLGAPYCFPKGHIPANKGKKQVTYMSAEAIAKTVHTRFQPGQIPKNWRPVGSERIDVDGYVWTKVAEPNKWRQKNHLTWEKHYGPIPKGMNCQFRDGNRQNMDISNLYLISKRQQLKEQNSMYARYPKEIQDNIRALGYLTRKINTLKNQTND